MSDAEQFLLKYEVLEKYFNEKKRPSEKLATDAKSGNPFYKMLSEVEKFWFYPTEKLSEEQLLQITDDMYGEVPQEWYTPEKEEISIKDAQKKAKDGNLIKWKRYPKNYFSIEKYIADRRKVDVLINSEKDRAFTDEQLKEIAIEYTGNEEYSISINKEDGEVCGFERRKYDKTQ